MPVAAASSDSLQIELTLPVACGSGSHDVAFLVTAWGDVRVAFDPCSVLPPLARQLAGGSCGPHVQRCCAVMQQYLQHVWTEDEPSGLDGSLNAADQQRLRELLVKARHRKHAVVDARHVPLSGESAPSDVRWQLSEDPAALWESITWAGGCRDWRNEPGDPRQLGRPAVLVSVSSQFCMERGVVPAVCSSVPRLVDGRSRHPRAASAFRGDCGQVGRPAAMLTR